MATKNEKAGQPKAAPRRGALAPEERQPPPAAWTNDRADVPPETAAKTLLDVLGLVEPAERFPEDWSEWADDQVRARGLPEGHVRVEGGEVSFEGKATRQQRLIEKWRVEVADAASEPSVVVSWWDRRRAHVQPVRDVLDSLVPGAVRAVMQAGGDPAQVRALQRDPWLYADTVSGAVAELRRAVAPKSSPDKASAESTASQRRVEIDLQDDQCQTILAILSSGPKLLRVIERDQRAPSRGTIKSWLRKLKPAGLVAQTRRRGPWRLTEAGLSAVRPSRR